MELPRRIIERGFFGREKGLNLNRLFFGYYLNLRVKLSTPRLFQENRNVINRFVRSRVSR